MVKVQLGECRTSDPGEGEDASTSYAAMERAMGAVVASVGWVEPFGEPLAAVHS